MPRPVTKGAKAPPQNAAQAPAKKVVQTSARNVGQAPVKKAAPSTVDQGSSQAQQLTKPATNSSVNRANGGSKPAAGAKVVKDEAEALAIFKNAVKAKLIREVHVIRKLARVGAGN